MANFEVTLPISGTVRIAIEANTKEEAIAKALAGEGHSELNEWQVNGTPQDAIVKAFDDNWEEIEEAPPNLIDSDRPRYYQKDL
jgi:hypothetical protein